MRIFPRRKWTKSFLLPPTFSRAGGIAWDKDAWNYPTKDAVKAAGLPLASHAYTRRNRVNANSIRQKLPILDARQEGAEAGRLASRNHI